jgi:hypothetical protein
MSEYKHKFWHQSQVFILCDITPESQNSGAKEDVHYLMLCHSILKYSFDYTVSYVNLKHAGSQMTLEISHIIASAL